MAHLILTGHGNFAKGLASALEMVAGNVDAFSVVTFNQDEAADFPDTIEKTINDGLQNQGSVLVFCDLKGGTPFNCSMMQAAQNENIEVIGGVNLPILIETVFTHQTDTALPASSLAEIAMNAASTSIFRENKGSFGNALQTEAIDASEAADAAEAAAEGVDEEDDGI